MKRDVRGWVVLVRIFLTYFTAEGEVGVAEEADSDDWAAEELGRVNV